MDIKLFKNYLLNTINELLIIITPLVTTPYLSRVLGSQSIGVFSYTHSIVSFFVLFGTLGTATYGRRTIAQVRDDKLKITFCFKEMMLLRLCLLFLVLIAYSILIVFSTANKVAYFCFIIYIVGMVLDISWLFVGLEDFKPTVLQNSLIKVLGIILILVCVKSSSDLYRYVLVFSLSTLLGNLSLWRYLPKYLVKTRIMINPFQHFKTVILLFIPTIAASMYTLLDKSMLGWICNSMYLNGCYEQSEKIVRVTITIITSISTVVASRIAYDYSRGNTKSLTKNVYSTARIMWALALPITAGIIIVSEPFVPLFLGSGFEEAVVLTRLFSLIVIPVSFSHLFGLSFLIQTNNEMVYTRAVCLSAVINIVCNTILIKKMGARGAAIASIFAEYAGIVYQLSFCKKNKMIDIKKLVGLARNYCFATALMVVLDVLLVKIFSGGAYLLPITVVFSVIVYFAFLFVLKDPLVGLIFGKEKQLYQ